MQDYMLEIKDRFANVCKHVNVLTGNDVWLVGVYSKKTGKLLANYQLKDFPEFKSYTALVAHAKANDLSTSCPVPVPSEDGATSTAESTPQDNPLSNGVPVSESKTDLEQQGFDFSKELVFEPKNGLGVTVDFVLGGVRAFVYQVKDGVRQIPNVEHYHCPISTARKIFILEHPREVIAHLKSNALPRTYPKRKTDDPENYRPEVYPHLDDDIPPMYGLGV